MELSIENKVINYCDSCKHRKIKDKNKVICGLINDVPAFQIYCNNYRFNEDIKINEIKTELEYKLRKATESFFYSDSLTDLIDNGYCSESRSQNQNSFSTLHSKVYYQLSRIVVISIPVLIASYFIIIENINSYLTYLIPSLSIVLFFTTKKELENKNKIRVDKNGLIFNNRTYLWVEIEGLYLRQTDVRESSESEDLIILMKSGRRFIHDLKEIRFLTTNRLKRIINIHRIVGLNEVIST